MADLKPMVFVDPDGKLVSVPVEQAADARTAGYVDATPKQTADFIQQREHYEKYGKGLGNEATAFGLGALRGASFGLSDLAARGLGQEEAVKGYQEENPNASMAGEVAGVVVPGLLTGGAGTAASIAEHSAPGLIGRAGRAVAGAVEHALPEAGESVAKGIARRAIAEGAGSAIEGAAYGAGNVVSEAALGDPDLTAEKAIAHIGLSAALGGGFGALLGAGVEALPHAVEGAQKGLGAIKDTFKENYPSLASKLTGAPEDLIRTGVEKGSLTAQDIEDYVTKTHGPISTPKDIQEHVVPLKRDMEDTMTQVEKVGRAASKSRADELTALAKDVDPAKAEEAVGVVAAKLSDAIKQIEEHPELYPQGAATKMKNILASLPEKGDAGEVMNGLLDGRMTLDQNFNFGKKALPGEESIRGLLNDVRGTWKEVMNDEAVFGAAGKRLAASNEATSELLRSQKALQELGVLRKNKGANGDWVKTGKLESWLPNIGKASGQDVTEAFADWHSAVNKYVESAKTTLENAGKAPQDVEAINSLIEKQGKTIQEARQNAAVARDAEAFNAARAEKVKALQEQLSMGGGEGGGLGNALGVGAIAHAVPGLAHAIPGAAAAYGVYKVAKSLANVEGTVNKLGALERVGQMMDAHIDRGVKMLVRGGERASQVGRGEAAAGVSKHFSDDRKEAQKQFERLQAEFNPLIGSPGALLSKVEGGIQPVVGAAPRVASGMAAVKSRAVNAYAPVLQQKRGQGMFPPKVAPSRHEMEKALRIHDVMQKPTRILKLASAGTLNADQVAAVGMAYPKLMGQIQMSLAQEIMEHGPENIPGRSRAGISLILGAPLDGGLVPQSIALNQAAFATAPASPPPHAGGAKNLNKAEQVSMPTSTSGEEAA